MRKIYLFVGIIASLWSCSNRLYTPEVQLPEGYSYTHGSDTSKIVVNQRWWEIFGDKTLNNLIEIALENNQDAQAAYAKIEQARLQFKVDRADYLPALSFDISAEGEYNREELIVQEYTAWPTISWEISFFGAMKNTKKSARAAYLANEYNYAATMLSLAADVATTYFSLIEYRNSLEISRTTYISRRKSLDLIDSMVMYGMSTSLDLEQSKGLANSAAASISQYERLISQTQVALSILLGVAPQNIESMLEYSNSYKALPEEIPIGLPSDLLNRRPDIMETYASLEKAAAQVGIARAARYPTISLTASGGLLSSSAKKFVATDPYALAWYGLASLAQPIFQFGKLKSNQRIAEKEYEIAGLSYTKSIISAFGDVD
ncbi:MAG: efflux transporter outer membrane subunit, partial [Rikenellaceae bacterium]